MPDFGREVTFGYFLVPNVDDPLLATAHEVERLGLDYVGVQDHPYQRRYVDTWVLLAMIAATTSRVGSVPGRRQPAPAPAGGDGQGGGAIDVLSDGRFELGLGAGGFWDAIEAYGGRRLGPASRSPRSRRRSR